MSFLIEKKEEKTILKNHKIALDFNGFPKELGSDNGREFCNNPKVKELQKDFIKQKKILYIECMKIVQMKLKLK